MMGDQTPSTFTLNVKGLTFSVNKLCPLKSNFERHNKLVQLGSISHDIVILTETKISLITNNNSNIKQKQKKNKKKEKNKKKNRKNIF